MKVSEKYSVEIQEIYDQINKLSQNHRLSRWLE